MIDHLLTGNIKKKIIRPTLIVFIFLGSSIKCFSQTSAVTQSLSLTIVNSIAIVFTSTGTSTGSSISIPFSTVSDYSNGVASAVQNLQVQSNKGFNVTVNTSATNFTYSGTTTPSPTMPISGVLLLEVTSNGTSGTIASTFGSSYTTLTSASQNLITNALNGSNQTFSIQYKATPGFAYPSGTYTTSVVFTATQL